MYFFVYGTLKTGGPLSCWAIVPDYGLTDSIAVASLADKSTRKHRRGWVVKKEQFLEFLT